MSNLTGLAVTVWKDGGWRAWRAVDAYYAENDPDWLATINLVEAAESATEAVGAKSALTACSPEEGK